MYITFFHLVIFKKSMYKISTSIIKNNQAKTIYQQKYPWILVLTGFWKHFIPRIEIDRFLDVSPFQMPLSSFTR